MNKQNIPAAPDENKIEELLATIQPVPSEQFHQKMKQVAWRVDEGHRVATKNFRLKLTFAIITLAAFSSVRYPSGTCLGPGGFSVLSEGQFHNHIGFTGRKRMDERSSRTL